MTRVSSPSVGEHVIRFTQFTSFKVSSVHGISGAIVDSRRRCSRRNGTAGAIAFPFHMGRSRNAVGCFSLTCPVVSTLSRNGELIISRFSSGVRPLLADHVVKLFGSEIAGPEGTRLVFAARSAGLLGTDLFHESRV